MTFEVQPVTFHVMMKCLMAGWHSPMQGSMRDSESRCKLKLENGNILDKHEVTEYS